MSGRYAASTDVAPERSRSEIERTLARYGARSFAYGWQDNRAMLMFEAHGRRIRFDLPMPDRDAREFRLTPTGRTRSTAAIEDAYQQAVRQRWRALALVIKAKLEAVTIGVVSFEDEFLAHVVLPAGPTVGQWVRPQIARVYETGTLPAMLPGLKDDDVLALGDGGETCHSSAG